MSQKTIILKNMGLETTSVMASRDAKPKKLHNVALRPLNIMHVPNYWIKIFCLDSIWLQHIVQ